MEALTAVLLENKNGTEKLIEVLPDTITPETLQNQSDFFCLDASKFGLEKAIEFIRIAHHCEPFSEVRMPELTVIITDRLTPQIVSLINNGLTPVGGYCWIGKEGGRSSDNCTFEEAFLGLAKALKEQLLCQNDDWKIELKKTK